MEKISINDLVNEVISDLPREILIYIAKNIKVDNLEKDENIGGHQMSSASRHAAWSVVV